VTVPSPWVALPAGTDVPAIARRLTKAREGFLSTGQLDTTLRRLVADSWRRSLERGADPRGGPPVELTDADLAEYRDAHPLAAAMPVVRRLLVEDAAEAGLIVALTDASGQLLWVEGAARSRRRAEGIGFVEGATWSEEAAGTNAPGTALALDHAVQIFGAEPLAGPVTEWSCSAAPIHAPDGSLLGAVDLTGGDDAAAPASLTLVRSVAAAIEAELRLRQLHTATDARAAQSAGPLHVIRATIPPPTTTGPRLRLLGRPTGELVTGSGTTTLRLRHAEILLLLTLNSHGLTSEQLAIELHDRETAPVTLRAELSRLRDLLARHATVELASRPYRLVGELSSDVAELRRLLNRGAYRRALGTYAGPVLPESVAPGVEATRERVRRELRSCLLAVRDPDLLWTFGNGPDGSDDLEVWEACLAALPAGSRRIPVVAARVRHLHEELG
jgi:transcriptional regulator of acetoin/glycerol metabolism